MAVEPRGACFKCGGDVTTLHLRVKDAQGRYGHVNCGPVSPTAATNECFIYTAKRKRAGGEEDSSVYVSGALDDAIVVQDSDHDSDRESGRRDAASGSASSSHFPARQREAGAGKERGRMMIANKNARIGIYDKPPCGEVPLQQFEEYALDRLRVLKGIDSAKARGLDSGGIAAAIDVLCAHHLPLREMHLEEDLRKDRISHYVLRMAFSRTSYQRRWILRQEERLFKHRFAALDQGDRALTMRRLQTAMASEPVVPICENDFNQLREPLMQMFGGTNLSGCCELGNKAGVGATFGSDAEPWLHIYRVPFEKVPDLVARRRVLLHLGSAFVICRDLRSVAASLFRDLLGRSLADHARAFASKVAQDSERLAPILDKMTQDYCRASCAQDAVDAASQSVSRERLPAVMRDSAPLCMQSSYDILMEKHHLKHDARRQLTLFLKAIGLSLEDCLAFWQENLKQKRHDFDRRYSYNIRHLYGAAGGCKDYAPFSCADIIGSQKGLNPPAGECGHGCPYKHWETARLHKALASSQLDPIDIEDICTLAEQGQHQRACYKAFETRHPAPAGLLKDGVNHPNLYFSASVDYHAGHRSAHAGGNGVGEGGSWAAREGADEETEGEESEDWLDGALPPGG